MKQIEIPEKLIEQFVEMGYEKRPQYHTVLDARRRAPAQIEFILSAVVRDEIRLPGEVGRCSRADEFIDWVQHAINFHSARKFIALCKEEVARIE